MKSRNRLFLTQCLVLLLSLSWGAAAQAQKVVVSEAIPNSAEQGTTLNVDIKGRGFQNGANVAFWRTGTTNPGGITVNAVTVHDSKNITANIDVDDLADIDLFDIEVMNTNGRKGKGITLFSVKLKGGGPTADTTPPSLITDFESFLPTSNLIRLSWMHSGDDGDEGYADHYVLLQAAQANESDCDGTGSYDFSNAVPLDPPDPRSHGGSGGHEFWAEGLNAQTCYAFSIEPFDEAGNSPGPAFTAATTAVAPPQNGWDKELIPPGTYDGDMELDDSGEPHMFGSSNQTGYLFFTRSQTTGDWSTHKVGKGKGSGRVDLAYNTMAGTYGGVIRKRGRPVYAEIQSDGSSSTTQITSMEVGGIQPQVLAFSSGGFATVVLEIEGIIHLARQNGSSFVLETPPIVPGTSPQIQFKPNGDGDLSIVYQYSGGIRIATFDASEDTWSEKGFLPVNRHTVFDLDHDPNGELVIIYRERLPELPSGHNEFMKTIRAGGDGEWHVEDAVFVDPDGLANQHLSDIVHSADGTLYVVFGGTANQVRVGRFCEEGRGFECETTRPTVDGAGNNVWLVETASEMSGSPGNSIAVDKLTGKVTVFSADGGNVEINMLLTCNTASASVICGSPPAP